jgi:pimeloyl-ACP methyl ester carboxylesterase
MHVSDSQAREHLAASARAAGITAAAELPAHRFLEIDELRLHYLEWGSADAPPMLFLHGGWLTAHTWDLTCLHLQRSYRCLALDLRGHGDSGWSDPGNYSVGDNAADLATVIDRLQLGRCLVVGQSFGAIVALCHAIDTGANLAGLVVIDTGPTIDWDGGAARVSEFVSAKTRFTSVDEVIDQALAFNPRRRRDLLDTSIRYNLRVNPDGTYSWRYDSRDIDGRLSRLRTVLTSMGERLHRVTCPTLVVRGEQSDVFSPADSEYMRRTLPQAQAITIPNAAHTVQGDNPLALAQAIELFARTVYPAGSEADGTGEPPG